METNLIHVGMGTKPDPHNFEVVKEYVTNGNTIVLARYHGCLTYDGLKLMLLKGIHKVENTLDPHFLGDEHAVVARFTPNEEGIKLAEVCAHLI